MLNAEVVPARNDVLGVVDSLSALQRLSQQRHQIEASLLYREVWTDAITDRVGGAGLGVVVALVAFHRIGRLQREIHRQRRGREPHA
jgi:hypothetical protein